MNNLLNRIRERWSRWRDRRSDWFHVLRNPHRPGVHILGNTEMVKLKNRAFNDGYAHALEQMTRLGVLDPEDVEVERDRNYKRARLRYGVGERVRNRRRPCYSDT